MILSDSRILEEIANGNIVITPFDRERLGPNSYDVTLSRHLVLYTGRALLDVAKNNPTVDHYIPDVGYVLEPGQLYLACTQEYTETRGFIPYLDGKSSSGRLGIQIHLTAGRGDSGFKGHWTLEISVVRSVLVRAGMPIGQLTYHCIQGRVLRPYDKNPSAKYNNGDPKPMASQMYKNFNRCEVCDAVLEPGLRFCRGLSECWRKGSGG